MTNKKTAYNYAIFLLSKRDYSVYKMEQKLKLHGHDAEEINETISKLVEQNYLREEQYKNMRIKSLLRKGFSSSYIKRKLIDEKLSSTDQEISLIQEQENMNFNESIEQLVLKKLRNKEIPTDFQAKMKLKSKIINFLASKGYNYDEATKAVNQSLYDQSTSN